MRISELSRDSGVPLPTVKFYLREGLLPPGRRTAATQAEYGPEHLARLRLIRALVETAGLSLGTVRAVLEAMASPDLTHAVGAAHAALSPAGERDATPALDAVRRLGWEVDPGTPALRELAGAMAGIEAAGITLEDDHFRRYAAAAEQVARTDVSGVPTGSTEEAVSYVVLGTVLFEPLLLALRKLAHQSLSRAAWAEPPDPM